SNGNTGANYSVKEFLKVASAVCCPAGCTLGGGANPCPSGCVKCQLFVHKTDTIAVANGCTPATRTVNLVSSSIWDPTFTPSSGLSDPGITCASQNLSCIVDPGIPVLTLPAGGTGKATLRAFSLCGSSTNCPNAFTKGTVTPVGVAQAADTNNTLGPPGTLTFTTIAVPVAIQGKTYSTSFASFGGFGPTR